MIETEKCQLASTGEEIEEEEKTRENDQELVTEKTQKETKRPREIWRDKGRHMHLPPHDTGVHTCT